MCFSLLLPASIPSPSTSQENHLKEDWEGDDDKEEMDSKGNPGVRKQSARSFNPLPSICFPNGASCKAELRFKPCSARHWRGEGEVIPGGMEPWKPAPSSRGFRQEEAEFLPQTASLQGTMVVLGPLMPSAVGSPALTSTADGPSTTRAPELRPPLTCGIGSAGTGIPP